MDTCSNCWEAVTLADQQSPPAFTHTAHTNQMSDTCHSPINPWSASHAYIPNPKFVIIVHADALAPLGTMLREELELPVLNNFVLPLLVTYGLDDVTKWTRDATIT